MSRILNKPQNVDATQDPGLEPINRTPDTYVVEGTSVTGTTTSTNVVNNIYITRNGPGGRSGELQINENGNYIGDSGLSYDKDTDTLTTGTVNATAINASRASLGYVDYLHISGGNNRDVLKTNGSGNLSWASAFPSDVGNSAKFLMTNGVSQQWANVSYTNLANIPTDIATHSYVGNAITTLVNSSPAALDTLGELANAIGNNANYSTTIVNALANKANITYVDNQLANITWGNLSGRPTIPDAQINSNWTETNTASKAYIQNKPTLGNISNINISGSSTDILYGNGIFAQAPSGANLGNFVIDGSNLTSSNDDINITTTGGFVQLENIDPIKGNTYVYLQEGNVYVDNNGNTWTFHNTGSLLFPETSNVVSAIVLNDSDSEMGISTDKGSVSIWPEHSKWLFDVNGTLILPPTSTPVKRKYTGLTFNYGQATIDFTLNYDNSFSDVICSYGAGGYSVASGTVIMPGDQLVGGTTPDNDISWDYVCAGNDGIITSFTFNSGTLPTTHTSFQSELDVSITANTSSWNFGTDGNVTLPTNTAKINYANGTSILSGLGGGASTGDIVFSGSNMTGSDDAIRMRTLNVSQTASYNFTPGNNDYSTAVWNGTSITFNDPTQPIYDAIWALTDVSVIEVQVGSTWFTVTSTGSSTPGMPQAPTLYVNETAVGGPLNIDVVDITINQGTESYVEIDGTDFRVDVQDDIRMYANDTFRLTNRSLNDPIQIETNDGDYRWEFDASGDLKLPAGGDILDSNGTSVLGTGTLDSVTDNGSITTNSITVGSVSLTNGSTITETSTTTVITPPGVFQTGQSLVIRPTGSQGITSDRPGGFTDGDTITLTVTPDYNSTPVTGTVDYTFTDCTQLQLGRALTGTLTFTSDPFKLITWTIPVSSTMTTFTITLSNASGFSIAGLSPLTLTTSGSTENRHVHLIAGDPSTTDIYLGDDDQYIKIERNGGNVLIGTDENNNQWKFDTDGGLTFPYNYYIGPGEGSLGITSPYAIAMVADQGTTNQLWLFGTDGNLSVPGGGSVYNIGAGTSGITANIASGNAYLGLEDTISKATLFGNAGVTIGTNVSVAWNFTASGNLTLPSGGDILDSTGTSVLGGSTYGNSNVVSLMNAFNGNPISNVGSIQFNGGTKYIYMDTSTSGAKLSMHWNEAHGFNIGEDGFDFYTYTGTASDYNHWTLSTTGNLTLPSGGIIRETSIPGGGLTGNTIALKPDGGINDNQQLLIYPTGGQDYNHLHLTSGNLYTTELYLGNDDLYVKINNNGNIVINSNDNIGNTAQWNFKTDGAVLATKELKLEVLNGIPTGVTKTTSNQGWDNTKVGTNLPTTGGSGTGLTVDVVDGGSYYSIISINTPGSGYTIGDVITVSNGGMSDSFTIDITGTKTWEFGMDGSITFPDNSVQTTAPVAEPRFTMKTADFSATVSSRYGVNTTSSTVTATLPASPAAGDAIYFADAGGAFASNNLIIARNGQTIMGSASDMTVNTNDQSFGLFYNGTTWRVY